MSITDKKSEDEPNMYIDHMWLEESQSSTDPWENVELEPMFQYPVMENEFLSIDARQCVLFKIFLFLVVNDSLPLYIYIYIYI